MKPYRLAMVTGMCLGAMAMTAGAEGSGGQPPAATAPIVVQDRKQMQEEVAVGPYAQPEWTTHRRFPVSRVYVQHMPYEVGIEQWWRLRHFRDGTTQQRFQEEAAIGLPNRVQCDIYETWVVENSGRTVHQDVSVEGRWALADWGRIPMNPTVYLEWKFVEEGADVLEAKLLLGDEFVPGFHWALNLVDEQEMSDARTTELQVSGALGWTVIDSKLGVGVEAKYVNETEKGARSDAANKVLVGPSLQWRPAKAWHVDLAPLVGLTDDSPRLEAWAVAGVEFGLRDNRKKVQAPISTIRD